MDAVYFGNAAEFLAYFEQKPDKKAAFTYYPTINEYQGKKSSYYEIISSLAFEECNHALVRIIERIDFGKINKLIDSIENISEKRREFYKTILKQRYEKILLKSYN